MPASNLPEGWDFYDPNDHERTGEADYEAARQNAKLRRMIEGFPAKEALFYDAEYIAAFRKQCEQKP